MKILAFTDTHGQKSAIERLVRKAEKEKVDFVICGGDLTIFEKGLDMMLRLLNSIGVPVFVIHGNHETAEVMAYWAKKYKNLRFLHKRIYKIDGVFLTGYGGGGFSLADAAFEKTMKKFSKVLKGKNFILVTHAPPYKTKIDLIGRSHCGSKSIANFIKQHQPLLAMAGHLHETAGRVDKLGKTTIINPGANGMVIEI